MPLLNEYNGILFDQLTLVERLERANKEGRFDEEVARVKREIDRKLYQKPLLSED